MIICLICNGEFKDTRILGIHVSKEHMPVRQYKEKFNLLKLCVKCGVEVSKTAKGDHCNRCRDRSGANNPFYGKTHDRETIERTKNKLSLISKELWGDPTYREKVVAGVSKPRRDSFKAEQSERMKKWYEKNPEQRDIRADHMRNTWAKGKIEPCTNSINESNGEKNLRLLCEKEFATETVIKKTIKIDGAWYFPDIIIGEKYIIEYYGDYWHMNPAEYTENDCNRYGTAKEVWDRDEKRIRALRDKGFLVLIIWQSEFKRDEQLVMQKIRDFINVKG